MGRDPMRMAWLVSNLNMTASATYQQYLGHQAVPTSPLMVGSPRRLSPRNLAGACMACTSCGCFHPVASSSPKDSASRTVLQRPVTNEECSFVC